MNQNESRDESVQPQVTTRTPQHPYIVELPPFTFSRAGGNILLLFPTTVRILALGGLSLESAVVARDYGRLKLD